MSRRRRIGFAVWAMLLGWALVLASVGSLAGEGFALDASEPAIAAGGAELDREARLQQALEAYAQALAEPARDARLAGFARAERAFASLVEDGVETAALWTNLGNAALQAQQPGRAVLAYHRALRLDPAAGAARQNLEHVRAGLPSWVPRPKSAEGAQALLFWSSLDSGPRSLVLAAGFAAMCGCVLLAVRRDTGAWRGLALLLGFAWVLGLGVEVRNSLAGETNRAVLVSDDVLARSADSSLSPLALPEPLPAGVEVDLLEARGDWTRVRLANGRDVWVRASSVEPVVRVPSGRGGPG